MESIQIQPQELKQDQIIDLLSVIEETAHDFCQSLGIKECEESIQRKFQIVKSLNLEIVPIGRTNAGKSTLINSILGQNLLNASSIRETTAVWRIAQSEEEEKFSIQERLQEGEEQKKIYDCKWEQQPGLNNLPQTAKQEIKKYSASFQDNSEFHQEKELLLSYPNLSETLDGGITFQILDLPGIDDLQQCDFIENYCKKRISIIQPILVIPLTSGTIEYDKEFKNIQTALTEYQGQFIVVFTRMNHFVQDVENEIDNGDNTDEQGGIDMVLQARITKLKQSVERLFGQSKCRFFIYELSKRGCDYYANEDLIVGTGMNIGQGSYKVNESIPLIKKHLKNTLRGRQIMLITSILQDILSTASDQFYRQQQEILSSASFKTLQQQFLSNQSKSFQDNYIDLMEGIYQELMKIELIYEETMREGNQLIEDHKQWISLSFQIALKTLESYLKDETQSFIKTDAVHNRRIIKQNYQEDYKKFILDQTKVFFQKYFEQDKVTRFVELKQNLQKLLEEKLKKLYEDNPVLLRNAKYQDPENEQTPMIPQGIEIDYAIHESLIPTGRKLAATSTIIIASIATKLIFPVGVIFTIYQLQWTRGGQSKDILKKFLKMISKEWKKEKEAEFEDEISKLEEHILVSRRLVFNKQKEKLEEAIMRGIKEQEQQQRDDHETEGGPNQKIDLWALKDRILKQAFEKNGIDYDKCHKQLQQLKISISGFIGQIQ